MFPSYRILCWNRLRSGGQDQELGNEQQGCVTVEPGSESLTEAGDHAMEKTESVNERLDLGIGTKNVDVETNESDEKVPVDSQEVVTAKGETEPLVDKEEVEPDMVSSNGTNLSDVNGSELGEDSELVSSGKQATIVDNLEDECLGGLKPYESSLDDDNAPVTAKVKPLVDKEEVEPDMVSSHGTILSDVKSSDLGEDSKPVSSGAKQGAIVDNLEDECLGGLKLYESILDDDNASPVTTKVNLSDSDLVWAKVRSHPWWPAQVFDPSAATDKANKYFKKGSFLVTYFGDCTFAWIDASRIKPFRQNFSQMAKQSTLPDFRHAIDVALEEVSRRIQFGLACSCNSEDVYQKIKTQNIINPGIREDASTIHGGDKLSSAVFFEPADLVDYVKRLAYSPNYDAKDELQFVSKRAQLLAFNRWKGYTDLPEFETLQGSVNSAPKAKTSPAEEKSSFLVAKVSDPEPKKSKQVYTNKRRRTEGQDEDTTVPKKKHKTLVEFTAEKRSSKHGTSSGHCFGGTSSAPDGESEEKGGEKELHTRSFTTKTKSNKEETLCWHPDRKVFSYGLCKECFKAYQREKEPYYCNLRKSAKSFSGSQQNKDDQPLMERDVSFIPRVVRLTKLREAAAHQVGSGKGHADESGNSSDKVHINQLPDHILEEIFSRVGDTKCCFEVCKTWFVLNRARQTSLIILPAPIPFFPLKDRGFRDLTSVTINHRLAVNGTHLITDNDLMKLAEEFPKLQILDLIRCDLITPMGLINVIERCKSLKWLYLQPPPHFDDEAVVAVKDCFLDTRLRILLLGIVPRCFEFVFK